MSIDRQTLRDLEVFSSTAGASATLFDLLNRTRTQAGEAALRQRIATPLSSADAIAARQQAHQWLVDRKDRVGALIDAASPDAALKYLNSRWQLPFARSRLDRVGERIRRPKWFRDYLKEVTEAQTTVAGLSSAAARLSELLIGSDPEALRELGAAIAERTSDPAVLRLSGLSSQRSAAGRMEFDQHARETVKPTLLALVEDIATVDAMLSAGLAARAHGWTYPRPATHLRIIGLFHPVLGRTAVPNDIEVDPDVRVCLLTGPNMAGKSTFMKSVAIAALLAHAGCAVPAAQMEFVPIGAIFSSVNVAESLSGGESFYLAEVRRIRSLALALLEHDGAYAIVDEPFRGTNVHDAAEATAALMAALAEHPRAAVFLASHITDLPQPLLADRRVRLLHFSADLASGQPAFDYRLRDGISSQRLGMILLRQEGVLDLLGKAVRPPIGAA